MRTLTLPDGESIPVLGQGTWRMGENAAHRTAEVKALREGIDLGLTLIDTAEMYGEGGAEEVIREAINGRRDELFIVSKVYPHNASRRGVREACERSLQRLNTDRIDMYLLHWRNGDIAEALYGFEDLIDAGHIRHFGVSNFELSDMLEWCDLPGGKNVATNQVLYNLLRRWPEGDLLPWCREQRVPLMAYTPLEPAVSKIAAALEPVARRHNASGAQIALAWVLAQPGVIAIPKASDPRHVKENIAALEIELTPEDLDELDRVFPPPDGPSPMEMN